MLGIDHPRATRIFWKKFTSKKCYILVWNFFSTQASPQKKKHLAPNASKCVAMLLKHHYHTSKQLHHYVLSLKNHAKWNRLFWRIWVYFEKISNFGGGVLKILSVTFAHMFPSFEIAQELQGKASFRTKIEYTPKHQKKLWKLLFCTIYETKKSVVHKVINRSKNGISMHLIA